MTSTVPKGFRLFRLMHKPLPRLNSSSWSRRYGAEDYRVGAKAVHSSGHVVEIICLEHEGNGIGALVRFENGALRWVTPQEPLWRTVRKSQD